ncbi:hypothetical protein MKX08_001849 [Trichoderma sp. CBMAI-0020]|nr:hypothetical protein MKX08_001849 [Trichoderma sp. CBMAI-0020]
MSSSPRLSGANKAGAVLLCCVAAYRGRWIGRCTKRDCSKAWTQLEVRFSAYPRWLGTTGLADEKLPAKPCKGRWDNRGAEAVAVTTLAVAGGREGGPSPGANGELDLARRVAGDRGSMATAAALQLRKGGLEALRYSMIWHGVRITY